VGELAAPGPSTRAIYLVAAAAFCELVEQIDESQWDQPGLGEWTVLDLVGHTSRAFTTVITRLEPAADHLDVPDAGHYYAQAHTAASLLDAAADAIAERGRQAVAALLPAPAVAVRAARAEVERVLAEVPDDRLIATIFGGMPLGAYLRTRTFELAVHCSDIADAIGIGWTPPAAVLTEALAVASETATALGLGVPLLQTLTGRRSLEIGFSIV
jgi:uncharacterized protein (TIGR03083 family)